jgi:hypothetical protein
MGDVDPNQLIRNEIRGRVETYYLVTKRDLTEIRANSVMGDVALLATSIVLGIYASQTKRSSLLLAAGVFTFLIALFFYYMKFNRIRELLKSGEIKRVDSQPGSLDISLSEFRVIRATYGAEGHEFKDVSAELSASIKEGKLSILASNDIAGDPVPNVVKKLRIEYTHGGVTFTKEFVEGEQVNLP